MTTHTPTQVRVATRAALAELRTMTTDQAVIQRCLVQRVRARLAVTR